MRSRSRMLPFVFVGILGLLLAVPAVASSADRIAPQQPPPWEMHQPPGSDAIDGLWFVGFHAAPAARGGAPSTHASERAQFRSQARAQGVALKPQKDFGTLWNGMTVRADLAEIATIRSLPSVRAVYPVAVIEAPEPLDGVSPALASALAMTGADTAQSELGFTGDGLAVAIIDSGIDYNHPDLGGTGDPDNVLLAGADRTLDHPRITHGWDYVGDDFDASDPDTPPAAPNPDPMDINGHGTHVAGIVGASPEQGSTSGVTGVAPGVTFGAYKVFGTDGSTTADIIVEALEDAFADGMDIANMSLGATFVWGQEYPTTAASNELANAGVVVVNSAGNAGAAGSYTLSAPANAHDIISVASADNEFFDAFVFDVEGVGQVPYAELAGAELPPTEGESAPLATVEPAIGCEADDFADFPEGHVALIERGDCFFADKYLNAHAAGASGVLIYNNVPGQFAGTIDDHGIDGLWAATLARADGLALADLVDGDSEVTLGFSDVTVTLPNPTGGLASAFTAYGHDVELAFGPSVMAPGGLINSTFPLAQGGYAVLSGTSMSAPHVAGVAALLLEAEPELDPFDVRDRLQNTSEPAPWSLNPGLPFADHTFRQGAGMVQVDRALQADQFAVPAQLGLGDAVEVTTTIAVTNHGDDDVTYTVGQLHGLETAVNPFLSDFLLVGAALSAPGSVTVAAGESTSFDVTITAPSAGLPNHQYGGYIVLTPDDPTATMLRVPYSGFAGDYVDGMPLLGHWFWGFGDDDVPEWISIDPFLSQIVYAEDGTIEDLEPVEPGHTYRISEGDLPVIEPFFGHFPRQLEVWAVKQNDGERLLAIADEYLPRSGDMESTIPMAWSGLVQAGNSNRVRPAPSGTYVFELRVLRALGDPDNDAHWDTWESPEFQLDSRRGGTPSQGGPPPGRGKPNTYV